jgi:hypothetical protein
MSHSGSFPGLAFLVSHLIDLTLYESIEIMEILCAKKTKVPPSPESSRSRVTSGAMDPTDADLDMGMDVEPAVRDREASSSLSTSNSEAQANEVLEQVEIFSPHGLAERPLDPNLPNGVHRKGKMPDVVQCEEEGDAFRAGSVEGEEDSDETEGEDDQLASEQSDDKKSDNGIAGRVENVISSDESLDDEDEDEDENDGKEIVDTTEGFVVSATSSEDGDDTSDEE